MADVHPRILAATRSQLDVWRAALHAGAGRVGWKIGLGVEEVEELIGTEPVIGHLTTATLLDAGGTYAAEAAGELRAETELAIDVGEGAVRGDPAAAVRAVARLLEAAGERLAPGDRILAGSSRHVPAGPGDAVAAEIDGLGRVEARITG